MATIIERDIRHNDAAETTSAVSLFIVTIVALAVLAGITLYLFQLYPFNGTLPADTTNPNTIEDQTPTTPEPTPNY